LENKKQKRRIKDNKKDNQKGNKKSCSHIKCEQFFY